ncbi:MAG TPA: zf-HC2 domain-containing protein [Bacteroidia bacterium]|jgi:hypothetical protein|nr:zf-HC2 domain-containing protein [Bacteroidia bacterium]
MIVTNQTHSLFDPHTDCLTEQAMFDYIDEKLSAKDCHAVEKHLLDCAFCSEAMEGLSLVKNRSKIHGAVLPGTPSDGPNQTGGGGRLIPMNYNIRLAAAAVLVLLLGCFILLRFILNENQSIQTATIEKPLQESPAPETSLPPAGPSDEQTFYRYFKPAPARDLKRSAEVASQDEVVTEHETNASPESEPDATPPSKASEQANLPPSAPAPVAAPADATKEIKISSYNGLTDADSKQEDKPDRSKSFASDNNAPAGQTTNAAYSTEETVQEKTRGLKKYRNSSNARGDHASSTAPAAVQPSPSNTTYAKKEEGETSDKKNESVVPFIQNTTAVAANQVSAAGASPANSAASEGSMPLAPATKQVSATHEMVHTKTEKSEKYVPHKSMKPKISLAESFLQKGMESYNQKNYRDALSLFEKALALEPGNENALFYSGVCYLSLTPPDANKALDRLNAILSKPASEFTAGAKWYKALSLIRNSEKDSAKILLKELSNGTSEYQKPAIELISELK